MSYEQARRLLLGAGLAVLALTAVVMYIRRVDAVEVAATLLFIPVFVAFVFWGIKGGLLAGILAAAGYAAFRYPAIAAVGLDRFAGLILSRAVAYIAFGAIGGLASKQLEASLNKLELYDQIDDETGLFNARFFVQDVDLEISRSERYQTVFSVAAVDVPTTVIDPLPRRQEEKLLRGLGRLLSDSVRTVDRATHARDTAAHRFAVVLPETGREGAQVFAERLAEQVGQHLRDRGAPVPEKGLEWSAASFPRDDAQVRHLKDAFAAIDRTEHPAPPSS